MRKSKRRQNGSLVRLYQDARTGMFYVRYPANGKHGSKVTESTGLKDKALAEKKREEKEKELVLAQFGITQQVLGALADPVRQRQVMEAIQAKNPVQVSTALDEYFKHAKANLDEDWAYTVEKILRKFVATLPNDIFVTGVDTKMVQDFVDRMETEGAEVKTRENTKGIISGFFSYCVDIANYHFINPAKKVKLPKANEKDIKCLDAENIEHVLGVCKDSPILALIACAVFAGLRRGELARLTWDTIDLESNEMRILNSKTRKNRSVPIICELRPYLAALPRFGGGHVFRAPKGRPWERNLNKLTRAVKAALEQAGFKGFGLRETRHSFGSALAQNGMSFDEIAEVMGNSAKVVKKHYARFRKEKLQQRVQQSFSGFLSEDRLTLTQ